MSDAKHTPWAYEAASSGSFNIRTKYGQLVCIVEHEHEAHAITIAANSHALHVARIEKLEAVLKRIASCKSQWPGDVVDIARAALDASHE